MSLRFRCQNFIIMLQYSLIFQAFPESSVRLETVDVLSLFANDPLRPFLLSTTIQIQGCISFKHYV